MVPLKDVFFQCLRVVLCANCSVATGFARATQVAPASDKYTRGTSSAVLEEHLKEDENRRDLHFFKNFFIKEDKYDFESPKKSERTRF